MGGPSCPVGRGRRVGQQNLSLGRAHDRALAERRRLFGASGEGTPLASEIGAFAASSDSDAFGDRESASGYPWRWSIYRWIEGDTAAPERIADLSDLAASLAQFLIALQRIDPTDGPPPGPHNFWRGGSLTTYDAETRQAIALLKGKINTKAAARVWDAALKTTWDRAPVWLHGDVSAGNLLVKAGRLSAVIDFGMLGVGDPACDLTVAWTLFSGESRKAFRAMLPLDAGTWARGRAWTLWKALIVAARLTETNAVEAARPWRVIDDVLKGRSIDV